MDEDAGLTGRVALVTGGGSGIGAALSRMLASQGAAVVVAGRSAARTAATREEIAASGGAAAHLDLDLASLAAVQEAARRLVATHPVLDLLVANAGVGGQRGVTADGFELAFGVNHLGHALLVLALLPQLALSPDARVVVVTSAAHFQAPGIDWEAVRRPTRSLTGYPEYPVSKLANVLFASELQRRWGGEGLFACSVHPGMAATAIWRRIPQPLRWIYTRRLPSAEEAAVGPLLCSTAPLAALEPGGYHNRGRPAIPSEAARDPRLAAELWEHTMEWLEPFLG